MEKKMSKPVDIGDIFEVCEAVPSSMPDCVIEDDDYDYREEYVTEDDIARENGFWVDDDGHWRELPDEDWF